MERALDGFPAAVLIDDCLLADARSGAVDRTAQALVAHILSQWVSTIERDLERFPPATIEVLQTIRQRMLDARDALLHLRSLLHELNQFSPNGAESDDWLCAGTWRSRRAIAQDPFERDTAVQVSPRRAASHARWPALAATQPPANQTESARP
jgi:hypothetical protein